LPRFPRRLARRTRLTGAIAILTCAILSRAGLTCVVVPGAIVLGRVVIARRCRVGRRSIGAWGLAASGSAVRTVATGLVTALRALAVVSRVAGLPIRRRCGAAVGVPAITRLSIGPRAAAARRVPLTIARAIVPGIVTARLSRAGRPLPSRIRSRTGSRSA